MSYLSGEAALERGGFEGEAAVGVGAVGPVEVLRVEVVEEEPRAAPDSGDSVQPPPRQAQHPVPEALGLRRAAADEDEPRRRRQGGGAGVVLRRLRRPRLLARRRGGWGGRGRCRHGSGGERVRVFLFFFLCVVFWMSGSASVRVGVGVGVEAKAVAGQVNPDVLCGHALDFTTLTATFFKRKLGSPYKTNHDGGHARHKNQLI